MRHKKNIFQMIGWRLYRPDTCIYCGKEAKYVLRAWTFLRWAERDLCEDCAVKWTNGELFI